MSRPRPLVSTLCAADHHGLCQDGAAIACPCTCHPHNVARLLLAHLGGRRAA